MKKIIVVDDEPDLIFSVKEGLKNDFDIIGADSGKQLFKILESIIPNLILLDIMMPEMSGWKVLQRLKENESLKDIPVIVVSARKDVTAKKAGSFYADDYIEKPFTTNDLIKRINKII